MYHVLQPLPKEFNCVVKVERHKMSPPEKVEQPKKKTNNSDLPKLSVFEQKRLQNLRDNKEMLAKLLSDLKNELGDAPFLPKAKGRPKVPKAAAKVRKPLEPVRRNPSRRSRDGPSAGSSPDGGLTLGFEFMRRSPLIDSSDEHSIPTKASLHTESNQPATTEQTPPYTGPSSHSDNIQKRKRQRKKSSLTKPLHPTKYKPDSAPTKAIKRAKSKQHSIPTTASLHTESNQTAATEQTSLCTEPSPHSDSKLKRKKEKKKSSPTKPLEPANYKWDESPMKAIKRANTKQENDVEIIKKRRKRSFGGYNKTIERDTRTPDEITQEDLDNVAEFSSGKKYDTVNGVTCHQCRQKTIDTKTICRDPDCWGVRGQFCGPCLKNRYGEDVRMALKDPEWQCPPCRGICNCSFCRARAGKACTGILIHLAREHGYNDVNSFLQSFRKK